MGPSITLSLPLILQASPHFFVGLGPSVLHVFAPAEGSLGVGGQRTTVSAGVQVGGYFEDRRPSLRRPPPVVSARRLGDAHVFVFTNDDSLGAHATSYAGTDASVTALSFTLGADYFLVRYVSVGIVAAGSYVAQVGPDPTRNTTSSWSMSPGGRVGGPRAAGLPPLDLPARHGQRGTGRGLVGHDLARRGRDDERRRRADDHRASPGSRGVALLRGVRAAAVPGPVEVDHERQRLQPGKRSDGLRGRNDPRGWL